MTREKTIKMLKDICDEQKSNCEKLMGVLPVNPQIIPYPDFTKFIDSISESENKLKEAKELLRTEIISAYREGQLCIINEIHNYFRELGIPDSMFENYDDKDNEDGEKYFNERQSFLNK